jgi:hypothetical protein
MCAQRNESAGKRKHAHQVSARQKHKEVEDKNKNRSRPWDPATCAPKEELCLGADESSDGEQPRTKEAGWSAEKAPVLILFKVPSKMFS